MKEQIWEAEFEGHKLRAINKTSLYPIKTSEALEIDGKLIVQTKECVIRMNPPIMTSYCFDGVEREIEVRFARKKGLFKGTGCQIFVDGIQIGGDKAIRYMDPKKAEKLLKKGFFYFFITRGLLICLFFTIMNPLFDDSHPLGRLIFTSVNKGFWIGLGFSYGAWCGIKMNVKMHKGTSE